MKGFFQGSTTYSKAPPSLTPKCGACGLARTCLSPKMPVTGKGKRRILIVGEAPGKDEDQQNRQFVGKTGTHLKDTLRKHGVDMARDCWLTNALICRPPNNKIPDPDKMVSYCRPNLINTIRELEPDIIIPLGAVAVDSLIGWLWKDAVGGISRWTGFRIPCQKPNAWICPTFHPSYVLRQLEIKDPVPDLFFDKHIKAAVELEGKPWDAIPNYREGIRRILDPVIAEGGIRWFIDQGKPIAFDYECNMLKPDGEDALIICCSISDGKRTIAFPWQGAGVYQAMYALLQSNIPKDGANIKFEDRWSRRFFKTDPPVNGWRWDINLGAHWMDSRPNITGTKFQAFVHLGAESYDDHIKPYLSAKKGKRINQILDEIDLDQLLLYCGMDSLLEVKIAKAQRKEMGITL